MVSTFLFSFISRYETLYENITCYILLLTVDKYMNSGTRSLCCLCHSVCHLMFYVIFNCEFINSKGFGPWESQVF